MPDEFGPRIEADAYRVYLYMRDFPDERVCHVVLRVGDDASVSFAKEWLHRAQPKPLMTGVLFDAWEVQKFIRPGEYAHIASGLAERKCKWSASSWKSLRARRDEKAGASEYRNGVWALDQEITPPNRTGRTGVARSGKKRAKRSARTLTPFQQKMQAIKDEAKRKVSERPRAPVSETQQQWQRLVDNSRSGVSNIRST